MLELVRETGFDVGFFGGPLLSILRRRGLPFVLFSIEPDLAHIAYLRRWDDVARHETWFEWAQ